MHRFLAGMTFCFASGSTLGGNGIGHSLNRLGNQVVSDLHSPVMDPHYMQCLRRPSGYATQAVASSNGPPVRNYFGTSDVDLDGIPKGYLEALLAEQKQQYELSLLGRSGILSQGYYRNPSYGLGMPYPDNLMANSILPSVGSGSIQNERVARITSLMRCSMGGSMRSWHPDIGSNAEGRYGSSLLDEFKSNKTRSFELSDIVGDVVEFRYALDACFDVCFTHEAFRVLSLAFSLMQCSMDQYGSRFIQQKLETATAEEKNKIFPEIIPHAHSLMTDVFGNYVIQKVYAS